MLRSGNRFSRSRIGNSRFSRRGYRSSLRKRNMPSDADWDLLADYGDINGTYYPTYKPIADWSDKQVLSALSDSGELALDASLSYERRVDTSETPYAEHYASMNRRQWQQFQRQASRVHSYIFNEAERRGIEYDI